MSGSVEIRDFCEDDLERAGKIALQLWGSETDLIPESMRPVLYSYLARYYFIPRSPLSCCAVADGCLCAFLLAAFGKHDPGGAEQWIMPRLSESEKEIFNIYKAYLDGNREAESRLVRENEAILLLFASLKKGCGSKLMQEFQIRCRKYGIRSMILWTDDTCDFAWYERNGFTQVNRFSCDSPLTAKPLTTFIFRKEINVPVP